MIITQGINEMEFVKQLEDVFEVVAKDGESIKEQMSVAGLSVTPELQPDATYRGRPTFKINKKEMRCLMKDRKAPFRVRNYVNNFQSGHVYMRFDKLVNFRYDKLFPKWGQKNGN